MFWNNGISIASYVLSKYYVTNHIMCHWKSRIRIRLVYIGTGCKCKVVLSGILAYIFGRGLESRPSCEAVSKSLEKQFMSYSNIFQQI